MKNRLRLLALVAMCSFGGAATAYAQATKLPNKTNVLVGLRVIKPAVINIEDLLLSLSVTNTSSRPVQMLFDEPYRRDFGPWMTRCIVKNSKGDTVHRHNNKQVLERKEWTQAELNVYRFDLRGQDYRLRLYALTDLTVLDDRKFDPKTGRLPPGRYTVQVFFYGVPSDLVSFELKDPPVIQAKPQGPKPQKSGS